MISSVAARQPSMSWGWYAGGLAGLSATAVFTRCRHGSRYHRACRSRARARVPASLRTKAPRIRRPTCATCMTTWMMQGPTGKGRSVRDHRGPPDDRAERGGAGRDGPRPVGSSHKRESGKIQTGGGTLVPAGDSGRDRRMKPARGRRGLGQASWQFLRLSCRWSRTG